MRRKEMTQMDLGKFVDRYNDLASLFLQKFGEEAQDKNIVFSPFSIISLLSILSDATDILQIIHILLTDCFTILNCFHNFCHISGERSYTFRIKSTLYIVVQYFHSTAFAAVNKGIPRLSIRSMTETEE